MLDAARHPHLAAYLNGLPAGLDSYPECQSKGTLMSSALVGLDRAHLCAGLPERLAAWVRDPPPAGVWVPAVHSDAVFHAVCDLYYPSVERVLEWTHNRTMKVAQSAVYRAIMRVPGPRNILRLAASVHGLVQRGTETSVKMGEHDAVVTLTFPERLHVGLNLVANAASFRGLLELTGGTNVKCTMASATDTSASYPISWE